MLRHAVQIALEEALDLPPRQAGRLGDFLQAERLLDVLLHQLRDADQAAVRHAYLRPQRDVLAIGVLAHAIDDELLGHQLRNARSQLSLYEVQHEVQGRGAARAGKAIAVDGEQLVADAHPGEFFAQRGKIFPMNCDYVVEKVSSDVTALI